VAPDQILMFGQLKPLFMDQFLIILLPNQSSAKHPIAMWHPVVWAPGRMAAIIDI